jgi:hypothetical protein
VWSIEKLTKAMAFLGLKIAIDHVGFGQFYSQKLARILPDWTFHLKVTLSRLSVQQK